MFVIWSGWGILSVPVVFLTSIVVGGLFQALFAALGHPELTFLAISLGLAAAAAANWYFGRWMNSGTPRELVDPRTNERVLLHRTHRLFWIRMEYWSVPVAIMAVVALFPLAALFGR